MATFDVGIIITAFNNAKGTLGGLNRDLKKTEAQAARTAKKLRAIQVVLAGIAIGFGITLAKSIVNTVGKFQLLIAQLSQVQGGLKAARKTLRDLTADFAQTPFGVDAAAQSFTRLRAAGLSIADATRTLKAGADAVAAFGGTTVELNRFIIGLQQAIGKGTLSMEELRQQIGEAVPSAMRVLAREFKISIGELFTNIEKGAVDSKEAVALLTQGLEKDFGGFAKSLSRTIPGALQGARAQIQIALGELFEFDTNAGNQTVNFINRMRDGIVAFIKSISQSEVDRFFRALDNGAAIVGNVIQAVRTLLNVLAEVFNLINNVLSQQGTLIAGGGLVGFLLFGKKGAAIGIILTSIQQIFGVSISKMGEANGAVSTILAAAGGAAAFGLIGKSLFGIKGPNAIVLAAGATLAAVAAAIIQTNKDNDLASDFTSRLADQVGQGGPEAGIKFLEGLQAEMKKKGGIAGDISRTLLGRQGAFKDIEREIPLLLAQLRGGVGSLFAELNANRRRTSEGIKETVDLVNRAFSQAATRIKTLRDQAETTTFSFGSQSAEKLRRKLEGLLEPVTKLREKIVALERTATERVLSEDEVAALEIARLSLQGVEKDIRAIQKAVSEGEAEGIAKFAQKTADAFTKAENSVNKFGRKLQGNDGLNGQIQSVNDKFAELSIRINKVITDQTRLGDTEAIARSNAELERAANIRDRLVTKLTEQHAIQTRIFSLQQKSTRLQIDADIKSLAREGQSGLSASFSSAFAVQADEKRLALRQGILAAQEKIKQLELEARDASAERAAEIANTTAKLQEFVSAQQAALASTSAAALLARDTWKDVGDTIQDTAKSALADFVKGTFDAEKTLLAFYDKITMAAIEYLFELIKIEIQQKLINAISGGGGGGGGFLGLLGGLFAKGGAFQGNVKAFANGDIIRGPTMFGVAGEAGTEAIMPLTRIGGVLGVRSAGDGGDTFAISVQAIDTQSGMQFIQKNAEAIMGTIRQEDRLNNAVGGVR